MPSLCSASQFAHAMKLVIDTDGVADDVRALSIALQHPDVQVGEWEEEVTR